MKSSCYSFRGMSKPQIKEEKEELHKKDVWSAVDEIHSLCKEYKKISKKIKKYNEKGEYSPNSYVIRQDEINARLFELVDGGV